jgi:hypothetical protein
LTHIWVVGIWSLVGQHKLRTAMSGDHLLLRELGNFDLLPPLSTVDSHFGGRNLASRRATQASHRGFHILQDNLSTIRGHVKRAPAALFRNISTSVGHLTRKVLTKLCVEFRVPELGTVDSNSGGRNLASRRATQASHPGFHILQDNLCTIKKY